MRLLDEDEIVYPEHWVRQIAGGGHGLCKVEVGPFLSRVSPLLWVQVKYVLGQHFWGRTIASQRTEDFPDLLWEFADDVPEYTKAEVQPEWSDITQWGYPEWMKHE